MQKKDQKIINIFWTGGWDSTFRLLQLIIVQKRKVQPYYIIDSNRISTRMELWTMKEIKKKVILDFPYAKELFLPVKFKGLMDIKPNGSISESYRRIAQNAFLGGQYEWLAFFAEEEDISGLELSIEHFDAGAFKVIIDFIDKEEDIQGISHFKISSKFKDTDIFKVFKRFTFPLIQTTKADMLGIAIEDGFSSYLMDTWFCHKPLRNGNPCGVCNPCIGAITGGMGRRLPVLSRLRYFFRPFISKKHLKKQIQSVSLINRKLRFK